MTIFMTIVLLLWICIHRYDTQPLVVVLTESHAHLVVIFACRLVMLLAVLSRAC